MDATVRCASELGKRCLLQPRDEPATSQSRPCPLARLSARPPACLSSPYAFRWTDTPAPCASLSLYSRALQDKRNQLRPPPSLVFDDPSRPLSSRAGPVALLQSLMQELGRPRVRAPTRSVAPDVSAPGEASATRREGAVGAAAPIR